MNINIEKLLEDQLLALEKVKLVHKSGQTIGKVSSALVYMALQVAGNLYYSITPIKITNWNPNVMGFSDFFFPTHNTPWILIVLCFCLVENDIRYIQSNLHEPILKGQSIHDTKNIIFSSRTLAALLSLNWINLLWHLIIVFYALLSAMA